MSSRYSRHYEDVARTIDLERKYWSHLPNDAQAAVAESVLTRWSNSLADLFAADNPSSCLHCGVSQPNSSLCPDGSGILPHHHPTGGFDRERFLEACGLEVAQCPK